MDLVQHLSNPAFRATVARLRTSVSVTESSCQETETVVIPTRRCRRLRSDEVDALVQAYQAGATTYELAERFHIHRTTVTAALKQRGIARRTPGRRRKQPGRADPSAM